MKKFIELWARRKGTDEIFDYMCMNSDHFITVTQSEEGFEITLINGEVFIAMYDEISLSELDLNPHVVACHEAWQLIHPSFDADEYLKSLEKSNQ